MDKIIGNKKCRIFQRGESGIIFFIGMQSGCEKEFEEICKRVCEMTDKAFVLFCFECENWNDDFSIWENGAVFGNETFGGNGYKTLEWLEKSALPYVKNEYKDAPIIISGYSLSGLFSLWAFYESKSFCGAVSCSGSLWFTGWERYIKSHFAHHKSIIYLSLGNNEEKTKNKIMSTVGDMTRLTYDTILNDENIEKCKLEYNEGGHFKDAEMRLAKGIVWAVENM